MKKESGKYLKNRIVTWGAVSALLLSLPLLALEAVTGWPRAGLVCLFLYGGLLAMVLSWAAVRIAGPVRDYEDALQHLAEGHITASDLVTMEPAISPAARRAWASVAAILEVTKDIDLSKRQAQYRALQNQINPHFLYNTLDGIRSEALIAGHAGIAEMTEALAVFFRYTISKVENLVSIEEELENCRTYFKIQQYRFGQRLRLEIEKNPEDWDAVVHVRIPKLTLQPLLENSIIHGTELIMEEGISRISFVKTEHTVVIKVSDNGAGMSVEKLIELNARLNSKENEYPKAEEEERGGIALVNVNNRIRLIFGEEYGMHVYSMEGVGTTVEIVLPLRLPAEPVQRDLRYEERGA